MKKIPTLFKREFVDYAILRTTPEVTEGMEWVLDGEGEATVKYDGSCCAIIDGTFYKRYDAKHGKAVPEGAIKCQEKADPITGHLPCWVKCDRDDPADKWYWAAHDTVARIYGGKIPDGTYEAVGQHFQGNPYDWNFDYLVAHGSVKVNVERTFEGIKEYLKNTYVEGLVFWKDGEPKCKIKRSDFHYDWNK